MSLCEIAVNFDICNFCCYGEQSYRPPSTSLFGDFNIAHFFSCAGAASTDASSVFPLFNFCDRIFECQQFLTRVQLQKWIAKQKYRGIPPLAKSPMYIHSFLMSVATCLY